MATYDFAPSTAANPASYLDRKRLYVQNLDEYRHVMFTLLLVEEFLGDNRNDRTSCKPT